MNKELKNLIEKAEDYEYYKGKAQGLDIAISNLETILVNISQAQDIEIQKMWEEERNK